MSAKYKRSYKTYPAWDYQQAIEDLNRASENGWQLIRGGCFRGKFVKNPDICYRYQLDFQKVDDMGRYIETFREQGWEYINSAFNGWHFFRKIYDPSLSEEEYEIFTDMESLREMKKRWVRIAYVIGILSGICALICLARMVLRPHLPVLSNLLVFAVESAFFFFGGHKMLNSASGSNRCGSRALLAIFLIIVLIGSAVNVALTEQRPYFDTQQKTEELSEPITDNRWIGFDVKYCDNYYLDLDIKSGVPLIFEIVDENGTAVYSETGSDIHKENVRIKLQKGHYNFSMSAEDGFELNVSIE